MDDGIPPPFVYEALLQPSRQIRLIRIRDGHQDEELDLELSTWSLDEAPTYRAISYTWGEKECCPLLINSRSWWIRYNGCYALCQARSHWPETYIWIDALCIDQDNLHEKAAQVALMERIFVRAECVLACVGPHESGSEILLDLVPRIEAVGRDPIFGTVSNWDTPTYTVPHLDPHLIALLRDALGHDYVLQVRDALLAFARRAYWTRLWIIQELAANSSIVVLCGEHCMFWGDLDKMSQIMGVVATQNDPLYTGLVSTIFRANDEKRRTIPMHIHALHYTSIDFAVHQTFDYMCSDIRDRIYAIFSLVKSSGEHLVPDYSKTPFAVAADTVPYLASLEGLAIVLERLGLHCNQSEMATLSSPTTQESVSTRNEHTPWHNSRIKLGGGKHLRYAARIIAGQHGNLVAAFHKSCTKTPAEDAKMQASTARFSAAYRKAEGRWQLEGRQTMCKHIKAGSTDAAIVCGATEANDILFPIRHFLLVLRPSSTSDRLDYVGQGLLLPGWEMWTDDKYPKGEQVRSGFTARISLTITPSDCLRLIGQDFVDRETYDMDARMQRLVTPAVEQPKGVAKFYDVTT